MATTTLSTPDPSRWLHPDAIGSVVNHEGKTYRVLGTYFAGDPEGHSHSLHQHCIAEEANPQEIPRWHLVRTRRGSEAVAERALEATGITVLLPRLYFEAPRKKAPRRGRPKDTVPAGDRIEPLFPGYLFARLAPGDAESWNRLRRAQGVEEVVGTGPEPLPVPDEVVDTIMEWSAGSGVIVYRDGRPVRAGACNGSGGTGRTREVERLPRQPPPAEERVHVLMRTVGEPQTDSPRRGEGKRGGEAVRQSRGRQEERGTAEGCPLCFPSRRTHAVTAYPAPNPGPHRVDAGVTPGLLTPPDVRVRIRRFAKSSELGHRSP